MYRSHRYAVASGIFFVSCLVVWLSLKAAYSDAGRSEAFFRMALQWGTTGQQPDPDIDRDHDGDVDSLDLLSLVANSVPVSTPTPTPTPPSSSDALVVRELPDSYVQAEAFVVTLSVSVSDAVRDQSGISITEQPPTGWSVSNISNQGTWDTQNKQVKWLFMPGSVPPTSVTYQVTPPFSSSGSQSFSGVFDYTVDFAPRQGLVVGDTVIADGAGSGNAVVRHLPSGYTPQQGFTVALSITATDDVMANSGISITEIPPSS